MRSTGPLAAIAAAALILTLAGCTGDASGAASDAPAIDSELTYDDLPLAEYRDLLWLGGASPEDVERTQIEQSIKLDERVVPCMKEQGFEYVPDTSELEELDAAEAEYEASKADADAAADEWSPDDRSWVERYGYGIVDYPGKDDEPEQVEMTEEEIAQADPNADYLDTLSESERAAYDEALFGPPVDKESLDGSEEYVWEEAGCVGRAAHELEAEGVLDRPLDLSEFEDLIARMDEFSSTVEESAELAELDAEWASCMSEGGESGFARQPDARASIEQALNDLTSGVSAGDGEGTAAETSNEFVEPDADEIEGVRQQEVDIALIDLSCREELDYTQASLRIQFDLETAFIADNKELLDAFKLAVEQGS